MTVGTLAYPPPPTQPMIKGSTTIDTGTYPNGTPLSSTRKLVRVITLLNPVGNDLVNFGTGVSGGNVGELPASADGVLEGQCPISGSDGNPINLAQIYVNGTNGNVVKWLAFV